MNNWLSEQNELVDNYEVTIFSIPDNPYKEDNQLFFPLNNMSNDNDDQLRINTSLNKIEVNQNSNKKISGKSTDKSENKNDGEIYIEISKANNYENWNLDSKKENIIIFNTNNNLNDRKKANDIETQKYDINSLGKKRKEEKSEKILYNISLDKFEEIIEKIKGFLFYSIKGYIKSFINGSILFKIIDEILADTSLEINKDLLETTLKDILSRYNKKDIRKIYEEKNQNIIDILNLKLKEFINGFKDNPILKEFYDNFIEKMKQEESDDFIEAFEYYFDNLSDECQRNRRKEGRNKKKKNEN